MKFEQPPQEKALPASWLKVGDTISTENKTLSILEVQNAKDIAREHNINLTRDVPVYILDGVDNRQGGYNPENDLILLYKHSRPDTIVHEIVHAVEMRQEKTQALLDLYELIKQTISEDSFSDSEGFVTFNFKKNISECLADGYSKEAFILAPKKEGLYERFLEESAYLFT